MRILLDECLPVRLAHALPGHEVSSVAREGWTGTKNGALLTLAEAHRWEVLLTVDRGLLHQNRLDGRAIAVMALRSPSNAYRDLLPLMHEVQLRAHEVSPGAVLWVPR